MTDLEKYHKITIGEDRCVKVYNQLTKEKLVALELAKLFKKVVFHSARMRKDFEISWITIGDDRSTRQATSSHPTSIGEKR